MAKYLISFDDGWMVFPEEDLPAVADAAHAVIDEAKDAGVYVFTGGLHSSGEVSLVGPDGVVTDGPYPETKEFIGGVLVVEVPSRGRQDRRGLPLRPGGPRVHARPADLSRGPCCAGPC
jgi:hypothetical protein